MTLTPASADLGKVALTVAILFLMTGMAMPAQAGQGDGEAKWTIILDEVGITAECTDLAEVDWLIQLIEDNTGGNVIIPPIPLEECEDDDDQEFRAPMALGITFSEATANGQTATNIRYEGAASCTKNDDGWAHGYGVFTIFWGPHQVDGRGQPVVSLWSGSATIGEGGTTVAYIVIPYQDGNGPAAKTRCQASIRASLEVGQATANARAQGFGVSTGNSNAGMCLETGLPLCYNSGGTGAAAGDMMGGSWVFFGQDKGWIPIDDNIRLRIGSMEADGWWTALPTIPNPPIDALLEIIEELIWAHVDEVMRIIGELGE